MENNQQKGKTWEKEQFVRRIETLDTGLDIFARYLALFDGNDGRPVLLDNIDPTTGEIQEEYIDIGRLEAMAAGLTGLMSGLTKQGHGAIVEFFKEKHGFITKGREKK